MPDVLFVARVIGIAPDGIAPDAFLEGKYGRHKTCADHPCSSFAIVDAALARAREGSFNPMAAAVIDAGGHLVAFKRENRSGILRFEIAFAKAYGALGMGFGSREIADRAVDNPVFFSALTAISGGRLVPAPGGVLIVSDGEMIGAVGISGDTSDNDEICALEGIKAVGFEAKPATEPARLR